MSIDAIGVPGQPLNNPPLTVWQAAVRDTLHAFDNGDTAVPWTPTASGMVIKSSTCLFKRTPHKWVTVAAVIEITSMGSNPTFTLPAGMTVGAWTQPASLLITDLGTTYYQGTALVVGGDVQLFALPAAGGPVRGITPTVPFTWANGDLVHVNGTIHVN